jgi:hypothetical protein
MPESLALLAPGGGGTTSLQQHDASGQTGDANHPTLKRKVLAFLEKAQLKMQPLSRGNYF